MNQNQRNHWARLRAKGTARFILRGVAVSALCAVAGHIIWGLLMFFSRGESTPYFMREPGAAIAMVVGFAFAGYLQSSREWRKKEKEYLAVVESEGGNHAVV